MTLELQSISAEQDGDALFAPVSAVIAPGEILTVMAPSGAGKSTLLDIIGGHARPGLRAAGRVLLDGRDVSGLPPEARRIGVLFQDALLFPHLSVGDNLAFGLPHGIRGGARVAAVEEALAQAGLAGLGNRDPATLSGGQAARAALMRTLLANPRAVLLDEPFSRLDAALRAEMRAFVFGVLRARETPALIATHDLQDAEAAQGALLRLAGV